jgi:cellulose synthase/poly-beta-1,6-N-acetylglucosamine synthase-like glycosyltransferase
VIDGAMHLLERSFEFVGEAVDFLRSIGPEQAMRVFWAFFFLEVPRYLFSDLIVLVSAAFRRPRPNFPPMDHVLVSVIVPGYNEADTIYNTVRSLREQDHPNIEIVIIDDGSTDDTARICEKLAARGMIRFFRFAQRQGKSAALNLGLRGCRGEIVLFMDSDSTLDRSVVSSMLAYFRDPEVGAVSGNLGVRNAGTNLLTRIQAIEYVINITVGRRFKAMAGILSIVPGALGAFRRELIDRVGGHEPGPGNDSDLTIRTRKLGKKVAFSHDATCLTKVPETWKGWFKQRLRWDRNIVRNRVRKHKDTYDVRQAHFSLSNLLSFSDTVFFTVILLFGWMFYLAEMLIHHPDRYGVILAANFLLYLALKTVQFGIALALTDRRAELARLFWIIPFFGIYRIVSRFVRILATLQELLFRWSYRDPFAPEKVREEMIVY